MPARAQEPPVKLSQYIPVIVLFSAQIRNLGPSSISSVSLEVYWPEKLLDGADMLYVTTVPKIIQGQGHCRMTQVNPYNITVSLALFRIHSVILIQFVYQWFHEWTIIHKNTSNFV